jgi:hypothetical protein
MKVKKAGTVAFVVDDTDINHEPSSSFSSTASTGDTRRDDGDDNNDDDAGGGDGGGGVGVQKAKVLFLSFRFRGVAAREKTNKK